MEKFAIYYGEYHSYYENYTWQKLPGGSHFVYEDCKAAYKLLHAIAQTPYCEILTSVPFPKKQLVVKWEDWLRLQIHKYLDDDDYPSFYWEESGFVLKKPKIIWKSFASRAERNWRYDSRDRNRIETIDNSVLYLRQ